MLSAAMFNQTQRRAMSTSAPEWLPGDPREPAVVTRGRLADPQLLILDEPTTGLDPHGIQEFRAMIRALVQDEGRTVFLSSHLLDEVERVCDHVAIVDRGRVVVQGSIDELTRLAGA